MAASSRRPPVLRLLLGALALLASVYLPGGQVHADASDRQFSAQERQTLERGELVTRPRTVRQGKKRLIGGGTWVVIDAAPTVVWQALNDQPRWPRMFPNLKEVKAISRRGKAQEYYIQQGIWPALVDLHLLIEPDRQERSLRFEMNQARDNGLEALWGFYRVAPYGSDRSILAFGVMADLGNGVTALVASSMIHREMLKSPITIKHFLERGGRNLYPDRGGPGWHRGGNSGTQRPAQSRNSLGKVE